MAGDFRPLASDHDLDDVLAASQLEPVIVFKHSESCGTSWMAHESLGAGTMSAPIHRVNVRSHRDTSDRVARVLGVRHESPQIVIVARGKAAWQTSHAGVTAERVSAAWQRAKAAFDAEPVTA
jgi:thioredoxin 1